MNRKLWITVIYEAPGCGPEEQAALAKIDELRDDLRFYGALPRRWVGSVRRVLAARAIQGSNSIEGYDVSVEDAVAAIEGNDPSEATVENWQAVTSYRRAMTYVLQMADDEHFEYSDHLLRSLHFMMTEYDLDAGSGLWRPGAVWVRNDETGDVVYEAPDHTIVPGLVHELAEGLGEESEDRALVRGAMAHLNLVMIHPFRDGNGRMARCLQTLVLTREGILNREFCSIEEYLGKNTQRYYEILGRSSTGQWSPETDARAWVRFCLEAHYVQAASVLRRVRESERIWEQTEELIGRKDLPDRTMAALFDAAIGLRVRNAAYRAVLDEWAEPISNQTASVDLRAMVDAGLLEAHGKKRGTYYVAAEPLQSIYAVARSERSDIDPSELFGPAA